MDRVDAWILILSFAASASLQIWKLRMSFFKRKLEVPKICIKHLMFSLSSSDSVSLISLTVSTMSSRVKLVLPH